MMRTEARLALSLRQRRFEWALARDEQGRTAARLVAGKTHDLRNLLQIFRLATAQLERCCDASARSLLDDIQRTVDDAHRSLTELLDACERSTRPAERAVRGAAVGAAVEAAVAALRGAIAVDARIEAPPAAVTHCTAEELEHLVIGLVLDASDAAGPEREAPPIELAVRARPIAGAPWIELVRGGAVAPGGDRFELRVVEAIAQRAGGELATSERRGGGEEVIVALPEVA
jgi:signal transduction histidine kinase